MIKDVLKENCCLTGLKSLIFIGRVNGSFGMKGLVKIKSFCEPKDSIKKYDQIYIEGRIEPAELKVIGNHQNHLTASIKSIDDKETAEKLKGRRLFITRDSLPELEADEFYYSDLLKCIIFNEALEIVGAVTSVENYGAGDIIEFSTKKASKKIMIPLNKKFIRNVDIKEKKIVIYANIIDL